MLAVAAFAGCGDSEDSGGAANEKPELSAASEPPKTFIERMATLLATSRTKKDCVEIGVINSRSITRFACPAPKALRTSMAKFKVTEASTYGTGAVVEYTSGEAKDGAAILLYVAPDRNWGVSRFGVFTKPSIGTSDDDSRAGYAKTVRAYLAAVKARDCAAYEKVAATIGDRTNPCKQTFPRTVDLGKRLKANPAAKLAYQGGNAVYGFYTLETAKPRPQRSTISVIKVEKDPKKPYAVLDVAPSPTAEQVKSLRRQLKQAKQADQVETSPSRKAPGSPGT